jgi:hypothetical protein
MTNAPTPPIPRAHGFRCPACGFSVYNRRLANCEKCHAPLPPGLRFTDEQIATMEAREAKVEADRKAVLEQAERDRQSHDLGDSSTITGSDPFA